MNNRYEEAMQVLNGKFGNKDNVIAVATISDQKAEDGRVFPCVREVDAYYEDGAFYVTTYGLSNKMRQIKANNLVSVSVDFSDFNGLGIGENLGWVMKPENSEIRAKLRKTFEAWYDMANNEKDENCVILKIKMIKGGIRIDHGVDYYAIDFENKKTL